MKQQKATNTKQATEQIVAYLSALPEGVFATIINDDAVAIRNEFLARFVSTDCIEVTERQHLCPKWGYPRVRVTQETRTEVKVRGSMSGCSGGSLVKGWSVRVIGDWSANKVLSALEDAKLYQRELQFSLGPSVSTTNTSEKARETLISIADELESIQETLDSLLE